MVKNGLPFGFSRTQGKSEHLAFLKKNGTSHTKTLVFGFDMGSTNFGTRIYAQKTVENWWEIIFILGQTFFGVRIYPILRYLFVGTDLNSYLYKKVSCEIFKYSLVC